MGLLQQALETYNANTGIIGKYREGRDPLAPIGHVLTNAGIEITLNEQGNFISARKVDKSEPKILIPVTEESGGRTSGVAAHPLCDNLKYISGDDDKAYESYLEAQRSWMESEYTHPFVSIVNSYVLKGTIIEDLKKCGVLDSDADAKQNEKLLVCWRVIGMDGEEPACWKNENLFNAFISYYLSRIAERGVGFCMVEGRTETIASNHPKEIISTIPNGKIISANDDDGFTYRGRFSEKNQAATVGYIASQKAHNALRWLASEQGVREFSGNRIFLCWNPAGKTIPKPMRRLMSEPAEPIKKPSDYREQLQNTLFGLRKNNQLNDTDRAVLVSFDAATKKSGRLAVTYYSEISIGTFLERMRDWDAHCCWYAGKFGIQSPSLFDIVDRAFGIQQNNRLETDDKIKRQHLQRLLECKMGGGVFPLDILKALAQRASFPQAYDKSTWRTIVQTACAAIQKYRYDTKQGGNEMAWELDKKDRSFQYGRLLAVMERAEEDYYTRTQEDRQTNAIKSMSEFRRRPFSVFERCNRHLERAYLNRIEPWQAHRYKRLCGEILGILSEFPEEELNRPLDDIYLMGYELQRKAFFTKNETNDNNEEE